MKYLTYTSINLVMLARLLIFKHSNLKNMLNKLLLSIALFITSNITFSQAKSTSYQLIGYKNIAAGGAQMMDENGKKVKNNKVEYKIFFTTTTTTKPCIETIWINQKKYNFTLSSITKLPIVQTPNGKKKILVKTTKQKVWQLLIGDEMENSTPQIISTKVTTNELLLVFCSKKEIALKKLQELTPTFYE